MLEWATRYKAHFVSLGSISAHTLFLYWRSMHLYFWQIFPVCSMLLNFTHNPVISCDAVLPPLSPWESLFQQAQTVNTWMLSPWTEGMKGRAEPQERTRWCSGGAAAGQLFSEHSCVQPSHGGCVLWMPYLWSFRLTYRLQGFSSSLSYSQLLYFPFACISFFMCVDECMPAYLIAVWLSVPRRQGSCLD